MGGKINTSSNSFDGDPANRKFKRNTSTTSTAESGGNTSTGTGPTGTGTGETETKKEPLEISILGNTPDTVKKTRARAKKTKAAEPPINATMISGLIGALSTMVASRPGMQIWTLSDAEIKSVADPLANIIQKSDQLSKIAEHTDAIALTIAVTTIAVPRVMYMSDQAKHKKEALKSEQKRPIATSDTRDGGHSEPDSQSNDNPLSSYNATA